MIGVLLSLATTVAMTAKDVVSKKLSVSVDGTTSAFASFAFALPFYAIVLFIFWLLGWETFTVHSAFFSYVLLRALSDTFAETFKMYALSHGEFSVIVPIISLHPVFLLVASPLLTNDPLTPNIIIGVLFTVIGSTLVVFQRAKTSTKGIVYGLLCAFFFALNNCFDRLSVQTASPTFSGMVMTAVSAVMLIPLLIYHRTRMSPFIEYKNPFLLRGGFEVLFMILKLSALQYLQAPVATAIMRLSIVFAVISGGVVFNEKRMIPKLIGAAFTVIGIIITLY